MLLLAATVATLLLLLLSLLLLLFLLLHFLLLLPLLALSAAGATYIFHVCVDVLAAVLHLGAAEAAVEPLGDVLRGAVGLDVLLVGDPVVGGDVGAHLAGVDGDPLAEAAAEPGGGLGVQRG